jgi:3-dehydroquinate synthase
VLFIADLKCKKQLAKLKHKVLFLKGGEESKSFSSLEKVLSTFQKNQINKTDHVVVIGGGSISDLVGLACSIYKRGINFSMVPTTLLSMVDSCLGGKNSINFHDHKNILGTIYHPTNIFLFPDFLKSLPSSEIYSGMGEIFKYALLTDNWDLIPSPLSLEKTPLSFVIRCLEIKKSYVEQDEFDQKTIRAKLNFGHTLGHALEAIDQKINHGTGVVEGIKFELFLSWQIGLLPQAKFLEYFEILNAGPYAIKWKNKDIPKLVKKMLHDKKNLDAKITFLVKSKSYFKLHPLTANESTFYLKNYIELLSSK